MVKNVAKLSKSTELSMKKSSSEHLVKKKMDESEDMLSVKFQKPLKGKARGIAGTIPKVSKKTISFSKKSSTKVSVEKGIDDEEPKKNKAKAKGTKRPLENEEKSEELPEKKVRLEEMKKKDRKDVRKSQRNNYALSKQAKQLWEAVRREDCPKQKQIDLCKELYNVIKDNIKDLIFAHDTSRVIECLVLLGDDQIKKDLYEAVKDDILLLMRSKYAKHFVMKMMKYGTKEQRNNIIKSMYGNVTRLIRHSEAANVVEYAYNDYANAHQRTCMSEEFYGPTFALFKDNEIKTLAGIIAKEPFQKDIMLGHLKETLNAVVDKSVIKHSLIHHILLEYFTNCNPRDRSEMIESIREHVVEILHTKDGARVGMHCIWHGTAKDRKIIIKSMKGHVFKICIEDQGLMVLLAIFDSVDDTKLVQQAIVEELMKKAAELAFHPHGRKVLLYLVAPRNKAYFHPQFVNILEQGDHNATSKKDVHIRRMEYLKAVSERLLKLVADNVEKMYLCPATSIVAQAILTHCIGNPLAAYEKIVEYAELPFVAGDTDKPHIIEHVTGHKLIKRLLQTDKLKAEEENAVLFSRVLLDLIPSNVLPSWINSNRGCFTLLLLLETRIPSVDAKVRTLLKSSFGKISTLQKKFKGAELLYGALMEGK